MATKIKVVEKTPGRHIEYAVSTKKITFGDDELSINLSSRERDFKVSLDICIDSEEGIVIGTGGKAQKKTVQNGKQLNRTERWLSRGRQAR